MKRHPEQLDDEIYLGMATKHTITHYGWLTKRQGSKDAEGKCPVFVRRSELEAAQRRNNEWQAALQPLLDNGGI